MAIIRPPISDDVLEKTWADAPGAPGFFNTIDHKRVGARYIVTAFVFFFAGGVQALIMRLQLADAQNSVVDPSTYNELFTMHGTTMIFLFNTPVLAGFGNYLVPLMIGARDMAYPRLNAFSYWIFVLSGIFIYSSYFIPAPPDGGWFAYPPLTSKEFSPDVNIDFWGLGVVFLGISTTVGGINFLVTAFKCRAPGMTVNRIPIFVWAIVSMAFMIIFALPAITLAAGLLELDRLFGTEFYSGPGGTLLYQHLFWFWGHPEVYILFIPATGIISSIITTFSQRPLSGYVWVATATIATAFISFGVWVHHMFATGLPALAMSVFAAASFLVTIPSGVQFFAWIATMWKGRVKWATPMLFAIGFLLIFLLGGITGVMVAILPFDWQAHDTFFVVAHFHYVLNGAVVFPIFGALYYWLPKITGRMLSERLGKWSFWTMFIGFNLAFFPMHILGLLGMPRRIYTYQPGLGWEVLNQVVTAGAFVFATGTLLTLANIVWSKKRGPKAPPNPWNADTLEWATSSPPPEYNFAEYPVVESRHPLWDQQPLSTVDPRDGEARTESLGRVGTLEHRLPVTDGLDARPDDVIGIPHPTYLPFLVALGITLFFVGLLIEATLAGAAGLAAVIVSVMWWAWRTEEDLR